MGPEKDLNDPWIVDCVSQFLVPSSQFPVLSSPIPDPRSQDEMTTRHASKWNQIKSKWLGTREPGSFDENSNLLIICERSWVCILGYRLRLGYISEVRWPPTMPHGWLSGSGWPYAIGCYMFWRIGRRLGKLTKRYFRWLAKIKRELGGNASQD